MLMIYVNRDNKNGWVVEEEENLLYIRFISARRMTSLKPTRERLHAKQIRFLINLWGCQTFSRERERKFEQVEEHES
jgi:hypothetical protein